MKRILMSLAFCLGLLTPVDLLAQQTNQPVVPAKNAQDVRKKVQELGELFGVEAPQQQQATNPPVQHKSMGDVMDKAIDKVSDVVGAMSEAVRKVAPDIWRIMLKQQYAKALSSVIWYLGALLVIWVVSRSFKKWHKAGVDKGQQFSNKNTLTEYDVSCIARYGSLIVLTIACLVTFYQLSVVVPLVVNPEYYAIQDLLRMILNGQTVS